MKYKIKNDGPTVSQGEFIESVVLLEKRVKSSIAWSSRKVINEKESEGRFILEMCNFGGVFLLSRSSGISKIIVEEITVIPCE